MPKALCFQVVRSSVWLCERFPDIILRMHENNGLKFGILMCHDHFQNCLNFGHSLLISLTLVELWLCDNRQMLCLPCLQSCFICNIKFIPIILKVTLRMIWRNFILYMKYIASLEFGCNQTEISIEFEFNEIFSEMGLMIKKIKILFVNQHNNVHSGR